MTPFQHYVALGDSMGIDDFVGRGYGAAALLHRNRPEFPAFEGRDLVSANPACACTVLAMDSATTGLTLDYEVPGLEVLEPTPDLITLTVGGHDFIPLFGTPESETRAEVEAILDRLRSICRAVREQCSDATLLIGTVYDPSDGSGQVGEVSARDWPWGPPLFDAMNDGIRALAPDFGATLVDIYRAFRGHGAKAGRLDAPPPGAPGDACWYCNVIEVNRAGADAIRRLWVEAIEGR